jgi:hypothetical protein
MRKKHRREIIQAIGIMDTIMLKSIGKDLNDIKKLLIKTDPIAEEIRDIQMKEYFEKEGASDD